jgi:site-specific DNA-methyltransferase (adenine-specific)
VTKPEVIHGDCLGALDEIGAGSVDLVYLDPPFFSQKVHKLRTRDRAKEFSFSDLWASHEDYARFTLARLTQLHRVLSPTGSLFFHCDRRASHLIRALLDKTFGPDKFRSEIIWHYRRWSNSQKRLLPAHQTILLYTKSDKYTFNEIYEEYSPSTNVDQILQQRRRDDFNKSVYARDETDTVISSGSKKGVPLSDVWDIPYLNPKARERTGYPTQKPVLLLERIIKLATNKGNLILDPFCGSGTTLVAAALLERNAIGIDISGEAVEIARERIQNPSKTTSELLKKGRHSYRTADENALAMLEGLDCVPVQRNKGIDAILTEQVGGRPVPVRVQRPHESITEAARKLFRAGQTKHAKAMFLVATWVGGELDLGHELPPGVIFINGPTLGIASRLAELNSVKK